MNVLAPVQSHSGLPGISILIQRHPCTDGSLRPLRIVLVITAYLTVRPMYFESSYPLYRLWRIPTTVQKKGIFLLNWAPSSQYLSRDA
ncbi:hypothetical protein J6590_013615, partial [Homalodisca vitripennis]